jgi:hypothetical protein
MFTSHPFSHFLLARMNLHCPTSTGEASRPSRGSRILLGNVTRQLAHWLPKSLRAVILLAATIVFFPAIVGYIVLASVAEDLPGVGHLLGNSNSSALGRGNSISKLP